MTIAPAITTDAGNGLRRRLILLVGQGVSLGLMLAFVVVTGMTLMLATYGAQAVPYVYILVAVLGSLLFFGYGELQRRRPLPTLSLASIGGAVVFLTLTWVGLVFANWRWLAFIVLVSFSVLIQIGFVVIGAQAGRLLDVREIKRYFPWIVSGFVVGFMIGGALVAPVTNWNDQPADMLLAGALMALVFFGLILLTNRSYGTVLSRSTGGGAEVKPPPMRTLLKQRTVLMLLLYQMLSAMASQILDFMVLAAAGGRFTESTALARFFGSYTVFLNLTDLLFVLLLAGLLLSRFGLRFGLLANPAVVIALLLAIVIAGIVGGAGSELFFWLVIATRVADLTVTDGTTRTSINAAYQALQPGERAAVQTAVEGIGVPVALGLAGITLLIFQSFASLSLIHIAAFTLVVSLFWLAAGGLVYRRYAGGLVQTMRRRALAPAEITIDDASTLAVVQTLLRNDRLTDVRLALDMLADAEHPSLDDALLRLVERGTGAGRIEALQRMADRPVMAVLTPATALLGSEDAPLRAAAVGAYCALSGESGAARAALLLDDPAEPVREAALVGLLRFGGISGVVAAATHLDALRQSDQTADRCLAAHILGDVGNSHFYQPVLQLLDDADPVVRSAALRAAAKAFNPRLLPAMLDGLAHAATRSAAMEALIAAGEAVMPALVDALDESGPAPPLLRQQLVRIGGQLTSAEAQTLFLKHLAYPDPDLRATILKAALGCGARLSPAGDSQLAALLHLEAQTALALLTTQISLGAGPGLDPLQRALDDALRLTQQRVMLALRLAYDGAALTRVAELLGQTRSAQQALALELLDVTLAAEHRALALPIVNPQFTPEQRLDQLQRVAQKRATRLADPLQELALDPDHYWRQPWLRACAAYAIGGLGRHDLGATLTTMVQDADPTVHETAAWAMATLQQSAA